MCFTIFVLSRGNHVSRLNNLQGMDREDGICGGFNLNRAAVTGQVNRATDRLSHQQ